MFRTNLQQNISILNQIRHIQYIGNKLISLTSKTTVTYHIGDIGNIPLVSDWYDSIFQTMIKRHTP